MTGEQSYGTVIYIDESGDLGFGRGGSRYFVIAALAISAASTQQLKRCVRKFKMSIRLPAKVELKASNTQPSLRDKFCSRLSKVPCSLHYIVIDKQRVKPELRRDTNILYNYAVGLLLVPMMRRLRQVTVNLDSRTIKVASGNSLSEYLRIKLLCELDSSVDVSFKYLDSRECLGIQAADMASNAAFRSYEYRDETGLKHLRDILEDSRKLFFVEGTQKRRPPAAG